MEKDTKLIISKMESLIREYKEGNHNTTNFVKWMLMYLFELI
jgi:hypothetical protein